MHNKVIQSEVKRGLLFQYFYLLKIKITKSQVTTESINIQLTRGRRRQTKDLTNNTNEHLT